MTSNGCLVCGGWLLIDLKDSALPYELSCSCCFGCICVSANIGGGGVVAIVFSTTTLRTTNSKIDHNRAIAMCILWAGTLLHAIFIECFRGRHRRGRNFTSFLRFSGPLFSCSEMSLFSIKACTLVKAAP